MKTFREYIKEAKHFGIAPHGGGSWSYDDGEAGGEVSQHPTKQSVGNEPFKDKGYFRRPKIKKYVNKMRKNIAKKREMPPVSGTPHPENPSVMSVVDGNHRHKSHVNARAENVPVEHTPHENVRLLHPDHKEHEEHKDTVNQGTPISSFREKDGSYNMDRPRKRLGGLTLRHYFVNPDGSHNFKDPRS
jgi:hypothetical protein